jgi:hypothetical protein
LSARLQPLVASIEKEANSTAITAVDLAVPSMEGVVRLFSYQNFSKSSKPKLTLGASGQPACHIGFASIFFKEGDAYLDIKICSQHTDNIWRWAGESYGEAEREITIEIQPEKDLFEEEEKPAEEPEKEKK